MRGVCIESENWLILCCLTQIYTLCSFIECQTYVYSVYYSIVISIAVSSNLSTYRVHYPSYCMRLCSIYKHSAHKLLAKFATRFYNIHGIC